MFVVDSAEFTTANQRATAEYVALAAPVSTRAAVVLNSWWSCRMSRFLYEVLTEPEMEEGPAVLVACHKSDAPGAKAPSRVKILLTQEL